MPGIQPSFYVASRASNLDRPRMWARVRAEHGYHFTSTWVDIALLDPVDCKPLGSWARHPLVAFAPTVDEALAGFCRR